MTTAGWLISTFIGTLVFYLIFGSWLGKYTKSLEDYYVAGRKMPALVIAATFMASWTSAAGLSGVAGCAWAWGLSGALWFYGSYFGVAVILIWIALPMRRGMFLTATDFFQLRFGGSQRLRMVAVIAMVFGMAAYYVGQLVAMGRIMETVVGVPYAYVVWGIVAVLAIYIYFSGMMGVAITDVVMFATILCVAIAFPVMFYKYGGWQGLFHTIPQIKPGIWRLSGTEGALGPNLHYWIGAAIGYLALTTTSPHLLTRAFTAKDEKSLIHGLTWGFVALAIVLPLWFIAVVFMNMEVSSFGGVIKKVDHVVPYMINNLLPVWLSCIILAGIMAAGISTANVIITVLSQSVVRDIWQILWHKDSANISNEKVFKYTRIWVLILSALLGYIAVVMPSGSAFVIAWGAAIFAMTYLPVIMIGLYWDRVTEKAAFYGMLSGLILFLTLSIASLDKAIEKAIYLSPTLWSTLYSFIFIIVVSYLTKKTPGEEEAWAALKMKMFPKVKVFGNAKDYWSLGGAFAVFTIFLVWLVSNMMTA
jgi:Na+/proline symporter